MAKPTKNSTDNQNKVPPGLEAARATAKAAFENETALRRMIDRLHVVTDDSDFVELHLDGEALIGGNGPETVFFREFGRLMENAKAEPAPKAKNMAGPLLAALTWMVQVYREEDKADGQQPEVIKAALAVIAEAGEQS